MKKIKELTENELKKIIIKESDRVGPFTTHLAGGDHGGSTWPNKNAWDMFAPEGTVVTSFTKGKVRSIVTPPDRPKIYGTQVMVDGLDGFPNLFYTHITNVNLKVGDIVNLGDYIGTVRNWDGGSEHLHLGIDWGHTLSELLVNYDKIFKSEYVSKKSGFEIPKDLLSTDTIKSKETAKKTDDKKEIKSNDPEEKIVKVIGDTFWEAVSGFGTDENMIYDILKQIKTQTIFDKINSYLKSKYGQNFYQIFNEPFEFEDDEKQRIVNLLNSNGIPHYIEDDDIKKGTYKIKEFFLQKIVKKVIKEHNQMKRVIKLKESDLKRIITRVMNEQSTQDTTKSQTSKFGLTDTPKNLPQISNNNELKSKSGGHGNVLGSRIKVKKLSNLNAFLRTPQSRKYETWKAVGTDKYNILNPDMEGFTDEGFKMIVQELSLMGRNLNSGETLCVLKKNEHTEFDPETGDKNIKDKAFFQIRPESECPQRISKISIKNS